ncbi:dirigent protein 2-like [Papaver somniferum]|uniref:dirigent protein 2-like n=1 Tax=Papaver somniferum TaxID=3469 RepID=UPI000E702C70|nr:dirigent protein 2-like [Papaver somniferum]
MATALLITPAQANHPHWGETVPYSSPPEKMTKLHFYLHDNLIGSNQTGFRIAEAAITNSSSTFFGATFMVDDPLTEGPDPESRLVGRAQEREFSIVGGTGFFRFARGFISAKTYWTNGFNSIIEWTCTVVHN